MTKVTKILRKGIVWEFYRCIICHGNSISFIPNSHTNNITQLARQKSEGWYALIILSYHDGVVRKKLDRYLLRKFRPLLEHSIFIIVWCLFDEPLSLALFSLLESGHTVVTRKYWRTIILTTQLLTQNPDAHVSSLASPLSCLTHSKPVRSTYWELRDSCSSIHTIVYVPHLYLQRSAYYWSAYIYYHSPLLEAKFVGWDYWMFRCSHTHCTWSKVAFQSNLVCELRSSC